MSVRYSFDGIHKGCTLCLKFVCDGDSVADDFD